MAASKATVPSRSHGSFLESRCLHRHLRPHQAVVAAVRAAAAEVVVAPRLHLVLRRPQLLLVHRPEQAQVRRRQALHRELVQAELLRAEPQAEARVVAAAPVALVAPVVAEAAEVVEELRQRYPQRRSRLWTFV